MNVSCHTNDWVMSHIWMIHVTHMNESCHTREWVMSHTWMSHVTHTNESCHTHEKVMSRTWMRHVTHMNASCHTHEWVILHTWMSHSTHMNESCHTDADQLLHELHVKAADKYSGLSMLWRVTSIQHTSHFEAWVMNESCRTHVTHMNESSRTVALVMPHVRNAARTNATRTNATRVDATRMNAKRMNEWGVLWRLPVFSTPLILKHAWKNESWQSCGIHMHESRHTYEWVMTHVWMSHDTRMNASCELWCIASHDSFTCMIWLIFVYYMTHACIWHDYDSFMCMTWLIHVCDMTHSCVRHVSFMCVSWLIHVCDMTHSCIWHDSFMCMTSLIHVYIMTRSFIQIGGKKKSALPHTHEPICSHHGWVHIVHCYILGLFRWKTGLFSWYMRLFWWYMRLFWREIPSEPPPPHTHTHMSSSTSSVFPTRTGVFQGRFIGN